MVLEGQGDIQGPRGSGIGPGGQGEGIKGLRGSRGRPTGSKGVKG